MDWKMETGTPKGILPTLVYASRLHWFWHVLIFAWKKCVQAKNSTLVKLEVHSKLKSKKVQLEGNLIVPLKG